MCTSKPHKAAFGVAVIMVLAMMLMQALPSVGQMSDTTFSPHSNDSNNVSPLLSIERYTPENPLIYEGAQDLWPYSFLNESGEPDGFNIDLIRLILGRLNIPFEIKMKPRLMAFQDLKTHELRTPLNAIQGFSSVLMALGDQPERSDYLRIVRNGSDMLQRLINDIIEASHINEGDKMVIQPKAVDFPTNFDDMCTTLQRRVQNPDVEFRKENPYEHLYTSVDTERIMQILTNFVTNAVKFTTKGFINVGYKYTTLYDDSHKNFGLYIYCKDSGIGIPVDKQGIIFNRFVKLDEFVQGTGMGLAICKSIAESCQGKIGVSSEGPQKGSTFWVWIPCEHG
jgi:signal transduction histidine kinase